MDLKKEIIKLINEEKNQLKLKSTYRRLVKDKKKS